MKWGKNFGLWTDLHPKSEEAVLVRMATGAARGWSMGLARNRRAAFSSVPVTPTKVVALPAEGINVLGVIFDMLIFGAIGYGIGRLHAWTKIHLRK